MKKKIKNKKILMKIIRMSNKKSVKKQIIKLGINTVFQGIIPSPFDENRGQ